MKEPNALVRFDVARAKTFLEYMAIGTVTDVAADAAGIPRRTVREWLTRGADAKAGPLRKFSLDCTRVMAEARLRYERGLAQGAEMADMRAITFWLERRARDDYGARTELVGAGGGPIKIDNSSMTTHEMRDEVNALLAEARGTPNDPEADE